MRTLDVTLLMGAALGQYTISYYSIVAVVVGMPRDLLRGLNLAHALLMIAQHTFQNVFIIESLHRGPPGAKPHETTPKEPCLTLPTSRPCLPAHPPPGWLAPAQWALRKQWPSLGPQGPLETPMPEGHFSVSPSLQRHHE